MATDSVHVSVLIPTSPGALYDAWLSSEGHAQMTGGPATIDPRVGGQHSAWDGYISGETLELDPGKRIAQTWRAQDFPEGSGHSNIVLKFEEADGKTLLIIDHTDIPEGHGERFQKGWQQFYIGPMLAHFGAGAKPARKAARKAAKKPAAKKPTPRKATAKKAAPKRGAAKKSAARKPAAKKSAARKPAAKKSAVRKPAAKKSAARKS